MTQRKSHFLDEFRIIPSFIPWLAALCWAAMVIAFLVLIPKYVPESPPFAFRLFVATFGGAFVSSYLLLVGYVNQDAKRRDMGQLLWTLLVILIPNGLGFLAYFLLRKPIMDVCPRCGETAERGFQFCARCGCALIPSCSHCGHVVQPDFVCCPYCGKPLGAGAPAST